MTEEQLEIVDSDGYYRSVYRVVAEIQAPGDYAHTPGDSRLFERGALHLDRALIYRREGGVEDTRDGHQGSSSCFPDCQVGDVVEASWVTEGIPREGFIGHFWRVWPARWPPSRWRPSVDVSAYRLLAHPALKLNLGTPVKQSVGYEGWQHFEGQKIRVSSFPSWEAVGRVLIGHFRSVYLEHLGHLSTVAAKCVDGRSDQVEAVAQFLSSLDRGGGGAVYATDPTFVLNEMAGSSLDLSLLGTALLFTLGINAQVGLSSRDSENWSIAGPWLESSFIRVDDQWLHPQDVKRQLHSDWGNIPVLVCDIFGEKSWLDRI